MPRRVRQFPVGLFRNSQGGSKPRQSRKVGYLYDGYLNDAEFRLLYSLQSTGTFQARLERNGIILFLLAWLVPNKMVSGLRA